MGMILACLEMNMPQLVMLGQNKSIGNPYWMLNEDMNDERRDRFLGFYQTHL